MRLMTIIILTLVIVQPKLCNSTQIGCFAQTTWVSRKQTILSVHMAWQRRPHPYPWCPGFGTITYVSVSAEHEETHESTIIIQYYPSISPLGKLSSDVDPMAFFLCNPTECFPCPEGFGSQGSRGRGDGTWRGAVPTPWRCDLRCDLLLPFILNNSLNMFKKWMNYG